MALSKKILDTYELWRTNEFFDSDTRAELDADLSEKEIEDRLAELIIADYQKTYTVARIDAKEEKIVIHCM